MKGRTGVRTLYVRTDVDDVMAIKPNFLTSMGYHIFLTMVLRARAPSARSSAIKGRVCPNHQRFTTHLVYLAVLVCFNCLELFRFLMTEMKATLSCLHDILGLCGNLNVENN